MSLIKFEIEAVIIVLSKWNHDLPLEKIEGIVHYDDPREDLQKALDKFISIMEKRIFVHRRAGMSRRPALVIGYLMYRDGLFYKRVKEEWSSILSNDGSIEQLEELSLRK